MNERDIARFWSKVERRGDNECWHYMAKRERFGYGVFWLDGKNQKAHRVSFFIKHGRWPEPMGLHSCDQPSCCNADHIYDGDHEQNMLDRKLRGRTSFGAHHWPKGAMNGRSKLTESDVRKLRASPPKNLSAAARELGVTSAAVKFVLIGRTWPHLL